MSGDNLTILVAFAAGLLSFLSPCVLPLVPAYLGQLTAVAVAGSAPNAAAQPLARGTARTRLRPRVRRGLHAARRDGDVRSGRSVGIPAYAAGDRRRDPGRPRPEPRRDHHDPRLAQSWRPLDAGAAGSVASATGTMSFASAGATGAGGTPTMGDRLGGRLVSSRGGWLASFGLGAIFAVGWTPCIGVILGGPVMASSSRRPSPRAASAACLHAWPRAAIIAIAVVYDPAPVLRP